MTTAVPPVIPVAIYTRKSTEEGLEQAFNSLDAQYEAALAYIQLRHPLGWQVLPTRYDDGGYTGGTLERPALQRLLHDIAQGGVQVVVTHRLDRISRSLLDFAQLLRFFEQHHVAFAAVTQEFDSSTPVGRLTLNVLSSFAQYERELIRERTREKMAATRRKGMYTGGIPPFGYTVAPGTHQLAPDPAEADIVRRIFAEYQRCHSVTTIVRWLNDQQIPTKRHQAATGRRYAGGRWSKASVRKLLGNPLYRGEVRYRGTCYPGQHPALIDADSWQAVQAVLGNAARPCTAPRQQALLQGRLRCGHCGCAMTPSCCRDGDRVYRYYLCATSHRRGTRTCPTRSIPAGTIESAVMAQVEALLQSPEPLLTAASAGTAEPTPPHAHIQLCATLHALSQSWAQLTPAAQQAHLRQLIRQVIVYPDHLDIDVVTAPPDAAPAIEVLHV
ncbi:MAG: DNA-invertase hin [bacterium ADurb.Bin429]|nr:MAG: DNA-invertase hin [bacterium ADurb.Bin429]